MPMKPNYVHNIMIRYIKDTSTRKSDLDTETVKLILTMYVLSLAGEACQFVMLRI
jgi:hypothetical protein